MKIWASHPKLKEGELLSSWLIRLAAAGGMTAKEFCQTTLSLKKPNLRIIDRTPEDSLLHALSEGSQTPVGDLRNASLLPEDGYALSLQGQGEESWVIPALTTASRISQYTTGMAFCPACFQDDYIPYYRKNWHFAFVPLCPVHRLPLRNTCPHCKAPYTHLQPAARRKTDLSSPIRACWSCGGDVAQTEAYPQWGADSLKRALLTQQRIQDGINNGCFHVAGQGDIHSRAYMNTLHCVLNSLARGRNSSRLIDYVGNQSGIDYDAHRAPPRWFDHQEFELRHAEDRAILLCLATWLMDDWPNRIVSYINHVNLSYQDLFKSIDAPYWLDAALSSFFVSLTPLPPSKDEIRNATLILRARLKRPVTSGEVKEFMSAGYLSDHADRQKAGKEAVREWHQKFSAQWVAEREKERRIYLAQRSQSKKLMRKVQPQHPKPNAVLSQKNEEEDDE